MNRTSSALREKRETAVGESSSRRWLRYHLGVLASMRSQRHLALTGLRAYQNFDMN